MENSTGRLVLASGSPRRLEILRSLGIEPTVRPVDIDETPEEHEMPDRYVLRLARAKASERADAGELVLGADTIVVLDDELLGKPRDAAEARAMLARLAGRTHLVATGLAIVDAAKGTVVDAIANTKVRMTPMTEAQIAWYVDTGEPLDKAGSYGIQGTGALFVHSIEGNYSNVVGLPLPMLHRLFRQVGYAITP